MKTNPSIKIFNTTLVYLTDSLGVWDKESKYVIGFKFGKWYFYWFFRRYNPKYYKNSLTGYIPQMGKMKNKYPFYLDNHNLWKSFSQIF